MIEDLDKIFLDIFKDHPYLKKFKLDIDYLDDSIIIKSESSKGKISFEITKIFDDQYEVTCSNSESYKNNIFGIVSYIIKVLYEEILMDLFMDAESIYELPKPLPETMGYRPADRSARTPRVHDGV